MTGFTVLRMKEIWTKFQNDKKKPDAKMLGFFISKKGRVVIPIRNRFAKNIIFQKEITK